MNCYYSPSQPAIGICKACGKGLSAEYAVDVGFGLACKNSCEERVRTINSMIDTNSKVMAVANTQLRRNTIFTIIVGLLFIVLGYFMGLPSGQPTAFIFTALGLAVTIKGFLGYTRSARYPTADAKVGKGAAANP
jgi:hypothetical protein